MRQVNDLSAWKPGSSPGFVRTCRGRYRPAVQTIVESDFNNKGDKCRARRPLNLLSCFARHRYVRVRSSRLSISAMSNALRARWGGGKEGDIGASRSRRSTDGGFREKRRAARLTSDAISDTRSPFHRIRWILSQPSTDSSPTFTYLNIFRGMDLDEREPMNQKYTCTHRTRGKWTYGRREVRTEAPNRRCQLCSLASVIGQPRLCFLQPVAFDDVMLALRPGNVYRRGPNGT